VAKFKKCNKYNFIAAFFGGFALLLFVAQLHLQEQRRRGRIFAALAQHRMNFPRHNKFPRYSQLSAIFLSNRNLFTPFGQ